MTPSEKTAALIARARERLLVLRNEAEQRTAVATQEFQSRMVPTIVQAGPECVPATWQLDSSQNWNDQQKTAIITALSGKSFCLIGAAGTGKTSTLKGLVKSLVMNNVLPIVQPWEGTKWIHPGKPGILLVSFTNMAVRQIAKHFSRDITCITIHKAVEHQPHFYEVMDPITGDMKNTMRFEPGRNKFNPLPRSIRTIVIDESSMVSEEHLSWLIDALISWREVQFIFLGDLNQIPPPFGRSILGRQLLELPIVELTTVYRQALLSPIITYATKMKDGESIPVTEKIVVDAGEHGKLVIQPWSRQLDVHTALNLVCNFAKAAIKEGIFDPAKDIILCPQGALTSSRGEDNFSAGQMNRAIADWLGRQRNAEVIEIIAGFEMHYYAVGDKLLVNKREAIIENISWNRSYSGKRPMDPRKFTIDRNGGAKRRQDPNVIDVTPKYEEDALVAGLDVDAILASLVDTSTQVEDRVHQSSHTIKVRYINGQDPADWLPSDQMDRPEDYEGTTLATANEINGTLFGYAVTVHKSQGSEWRNVFIFLHASLHAMCYRELLYTAITRAAKYCHIICEPDRGLKVGTLTKAAKNPRIKGNTLQEKLASLKVLLDREKGEKQQAEDEQSESKEGELT